LTKEERAKSAEIFFQKLFADRKDLCSDLCSEKAARKSEVPPPNTKVPVVRHFLMTVHVPAKVLRLLERLVGPDKL
jgi:hypothetical protein